MEFNMDFLVPTVQTKLYWTNFMQKCYIYFEWK